MCTKGVTDKLLFGFPSRLGQKMLQFPSYAFLIIFENDWSIFSRRSCEIYLRNKDFSSVDDLCLITIRHPSDLRPFIFPLSPTTLRPRLEGPRRKGCGCRQPCPGTTVSPPAAVQWDVILVATLLLIKDIF